MKSANALLTFLRKLFNVPFITFIAGGLLATAIQIFFEKSILGNLLILLIFLSAYIFYTVITVEKINRAMIQDIDENHRATISTIQDLHRDIFAQVQSLGLIVRWISNPTFEQDEGYELSLKLVQEAQKSIYIISDYSPHDRRISYTEERREYLSAIGRVVNERIARNSSFEYKRILQSDRADEVHRILERWLLKGDEQTFDHCSEVIRAIQSNRNGRNSVTVQFFVSKPIPSSPSILIVDQKYVLFTITGKKSVIGSTYHDSADLITAGVLYFEDYAGKLVADCTRLFDSFASDSVPIANVEI